MIVAITNLAGPGANMFGVKQPAKWTFSELMQNIPSGRIKSIEIQQDNRTITGSLNSSPDDKFTVDGPAPESTDWTALTNTLVANNKDAALKGEPTKAVSYVYL